MTWVVVCWMVVAAVQASQRAEPQNSLTLTTLDCHRRNYSYSVTKRDSQGRACRDNVEVMSCWGRCDSNEISDWCFRYKRSYHPVCLHDARELATVMFTDCDSDISDWRFPYKRSYHPVCLHDARELTTVILRDCDPDVEPGTERYEFLQALSCRCLVCKSSEASCEGLRYRGMNGG